MDKTAETPPRGQRFDPGFGGIEGALAVSLALHVLLLFLPHPALWFPLSAIPYRAVHAAQWVKLPRPPAPVEDGTRSMASHLRGPMVPMPGRAASRTEPSSLQPIDYRLARSLSRPIQVLGGLEDDDDWLLDSASGAALFRVIVSSDGSARYVEVLVSTLPPEVEKQAVLKLYAASYRPGEIDGIAVTAESFIEMKLSAAVTKDAIGGR